MGIKDPWWILLIFSEEKVDEKAETDRNTFCNDISHASKSFAEWLLYVHTAGGRNITYSPQASPPPPPPPWPN